MSSHTPSSRAQSPNSDGFITPIRQSDTDTTPSPSKWSSPPISPDQLSSKLALLEAATALSAAADTLAAASQAMSLAAKSLAAASGSLAHGSREESYARYVSTHQDYANEDYSRSPSEFEWQVPSYSLGTTSSQQAEVTKPIHSGTSVKVEIPTQVTSSIANEYVQPSAVEEPSHSLAHPGPQSISSAPSAPHELLSNEDAYLDTFAQSTKPDLGRGEPGDRTTEPGQPSESVNPPSASVSIAKVAVDLPTAVVQAPAPDVTATSSSSQQYIILNEEFDIIPLICHSAKTNPGKNILCFVRDVNMMSELCNLINNMVPQPIFMLAPGGSKGPKKAAAKACDSEGGSLIFASIFSPELPESIRSKSFHSVIHVGWTGDKSLYKRQSNRSGLRHHTLIVTNDECQASNITSESLTLSGYACSPHTQTYNSTDSTGKFSKVRKAWKKQLGDEVYGVLCCCFEAWITFHFTGSHRVKGWSAMDVAREANIFAKKVLLHGHAKGVPRNPVHPTIGPRLSVTSDFVSTLGLQEPVQSKILVVGEFDD